MQKAGFLITRLIYYRSIIITYFEMLDVLSYNEGSRKSIYFGFQLKLKKLLTRVVPAQIISIISISIIIHDSPKMSNRPSYSMPALFYFNLWRFVLLKKTNEKQCMSHTQTVSLPFAYALHVRQVRYRHAQSSS